MEPYKFYATLEQGKLLTYRQSPYGAHDPPLMGVSAMG